MLTMREEGENENAIREMTALRWKPTHVTKHTSSVIPLHISQNTSKSGRIKTALTVSIDTVNQATYNIRRDSNWWYIQPRGNSLTTRSMKLHHQTRGPET